jgi:hypothetical protein
MEFKTPGVYIRDVEVSPPARVRLDIAGFVGQAERGPLHFPQPLTSWGQFRDIFGDFTGFSFLAYAVFGFFLNGGTRCYVVRVAHETAQLARLELDDMEHEAVMRVLGINTGARGNAINVTVEERSTGDMRLTELAGDVGVGEDTVVLQSVAGLAQENATEEEPGDLITLLHKEDPFIREVKRIRRIDFAAQSVTFSSPVAHRFPAGSSVLGKGFTMTFRDQPGGMVIREEVFENLSLNPSHERYVVRVINGDQEEKDYVERIRNERSILVRVADLTQGRGRAGARPQRIDNRRALEGGDDGPQALEARYHTGYDNGAYFRPLPPDADAQQRREVAEKLFGLATFETVLNVGLIALPDLVIGDLARFYADNPGVQQPKAGIIFGPAPRTALAFSNLQTGQRDMLRHCAIMGDRFAICDAPPGAEVGKGTTRIEDWPNLFQLLPDSKYGALYYPWVKENAADFGGRDLFIPPSGHVAGIYARTEGASGVGRAPANAVLQGVIDLESRLSTTEQDLLNLRGVNCLRMFPGRGLRVWGARTLSADPVWRYVNVRRVYLAIVKYILGNLQWTVFEPHDTALRARMTASLTLFLRQLFLEGALVGNTPDAAFFVKCNDESNPPEVVTHGEVIAEIGFAPARPAEFILVTIKRTAASLSAGEAVL